RDPPFPSGSGGSLSRVRGAYGRVPLLQIVATVVLGHLDVGLVERPPADGHEVADLLLVESVDLAPVGTADEFGLVRVIVRHRPALLSVALALDHATVVLLLAAGAAPVGVPGDVAVVD